MIRLHRLMLKAIFRQPRETLPASTSWDASVPTGSGAGAGLDSSATNLLLSADCRAGDTGIPIASISVLGRCLASL